MMQKQIFTLKHSLSGLLMAAVFTGSWLNAADAGNDPAPPIREKPIGAAAGAAGVRRDAMPGMMARPELTDDQKAIVKKSMEANREKMQGFQEQREKITKELKDLVMADKFDEAAVQEKVDALSKLQSDQMMMGLKLFAELAPTLTPEQKERLQNAPPQALSMILMGGGFQRLGAGGGFGGQGAGGRRDGQTTRPGWEAPAPR
ncbi:MAG: Spy/CpxP family protein refolding chaperone [Verrucomicrobiota bacterium]